MVRYELSKVFRRRVTMVLLALLLIINAVVVWNQAAPGVAPYTDMDVKHIRTLYKALPDDKELAFSALVEKDEVLSQAIWNETDPGGYLTGDLYTEIQLFRELIERVEPIVNYSGILQEIQENAETLLLTGRYKEDSFAYKSILRTRVQYHNLTDVEPVILYSGAIEFLPGRGITEVIAILMALLVALELIFSEREKGTMALCKPTHRGYFSLIVGKLVAGLLIGALVILLLYGSNFTIGLIRCGPVDLSVPVQSVYGMIRSPWKITILEYIEWFFGVRILWTFSVMAIAYPASYVGKKLWQCCGIFILLGSICYLPSDSLLNPFTEGTATELFGNYRNLNIFGFPVSNLMASLWVMILVLVVGVVGVILSHCNLSPIISERAGTQKKRKTPKPLSLFGYEGHKILFMNGGIYILILLLAVQIFVYSDFSNEISPQEQLYISYSDVLSGMANEEKDAYILQEENRFADLYSKLEDYSEALAKGEISEDSYSVLSGGVQRQLTSEPVFHRARDQYLSMKEKGLEYVCLTPYNRLLGVEGKKELLRQSIFLVLTLGVGLSTVFATEFETGVAVLLRTVEREKESYRKKRGIAILYGLMGTGLVYAPQLIAVWLSYGLTGLTASAGSVPPLALNIGTVWSALGFYGLILCAISVVVSSMILLISQKTRNSVHTCLYTFALFVPPCVLGMFVL